MEVEGVEFQDWEVVLPKSDDTGPVVDSSSSSSDSVVLDSALANLDEAESEGMIRYDYFSLASKCRYDKIAVQSDVSEEGSVHSDNPSWIDPGAAEQQYSSKHPAHFWSDSGSDRSDGRKVSDFDASSELDLANVVRNFGELPELEGGHRVSGEVMADSDGKAVDFDLINELGMVEKSETEMGFERFGEIGRWSKDSDRVMFDHEITCGDGGKTEGMDYDLDAASVVQGGGEGDAEEKCLTMAEGSRDSKSGGDGGKMSIVWWKVPFEMLKYCVFRVSPVWSFSVAAAFVGFVFLGRKLYKMKRKSPGLNLKITMDDKKVSQFMVHAARLNDAFSVVRRVHIIRPPMPATGVNPWPVMSLR